MLVVTRKKDEVIRLVPKEGVVLSPDDVIEITICGLRRDKVRVGITAPKSIQVKRPDAKNQEPKAEKQAVKSGH